MKPTFALVHTESVNPYLNSVCHIIIIPVIDGVPGQPLEYIVDPGNVPFDFVASGISEDELYNAPAVASVWPEIQSKLKEFPIVLSSAEGYSMHAVYGTLTRLKIPFDRMEYINAKAICRRAMNKISYNFDFLSSEFFHDTVPENAPEAIAMRWAELALLALERSQAADLRQFANDVKIRIGSVSQEEFMPSICVHVKKYSKKNSFDASGITVNADPENPFFEMNVVFTGKMESMTRDEGRTAVIAIGGFAPDRLTMDTNYLVVGKQDLRVVGEKGLSGKMKTAAKYKDKGCDIEVISEPEFLEMLGTANIYNK